MIPSSLRSKFFIDGFFSPVKLYSPEDASHLYMEYTKYVDKFGNNGTLGKSNLAQMYIFIILSNEN